MDALFELPYKDRSTIIPSIRYQDEEGSDAGNSHIFIHNLKVSGGLRRAWFVENTKILFDPAIGLFKYTENKQAVHPNIASKSIPDYLRYFEYAGYHVALVNDIDFRLPNLFFPFLKGDSHKILH